MITEMLTRNEVAAQLRVCSASVPNYVKKGWLPEPVWVGHRQFFDKEAVEKVAREGTRKS